MKVLIIAAISADGFIARNSHELADWTSKEDKKLFVELTKRTGVLVMGGNTYRTIGHPLPGRKNIVYTRRPLSESDVEVTQENPRELVARLAAEGFKEVAICGGRSIYSMFLECGLVDEIFLTVEPIAFGSGVTLWDVPHNLALSLKEHRKLNDDTLLLNYEVIK